MVSQREIRDLSQLREALQSATEEIGERIAGGAFVEPGEYSFDGGHVIRRETQLRLNRLRLLSRIVDPDDFAFVAGNLPASRKFRKNRIRIFRLYLRQAHREVWISYRVQVDHIRMAAAWSRKYPPLLARTARTLLSLGKLRLALLLFRCHMPALVRIGGNVDRLVSFASHPGSSAVLKS